MMLRVSKAMPIGTVAGAAVLAFSKESRERYAVLGTSFAIFSWTLGQLFWFSYSLVTGLELPYPSVGDMGFVGTYVILFSVIDILKQKNIELFKRYNRSYYILALAAVPIVLSVLGREPVKTVVVNFILSFSAVWAMFKAAFLWKHKGYRMFSAGVLLLGVTDIFFVSSVVFFPLGVVIITDPLYPIALSMIAWGITKGECTPDD